MTSRPPNDFPRPPLIARLLVAVTTPAREREFVLGDLHQGYVQLLATASRATARRWLWRQSMSLIRARWPRLGTVVINRPREKSMSSLWNEFRVALRSLRRAPLFTTLAILTAAVGIGASTAIYSVARPIIFESAPYRAPDKLMYVWERQQDGTSSNVGFPTYQDFARDVQAFSSSAVMSYWQITLASEGSAERVFGQRVSANYFNTLGIRPFLGRDFRPEEDTYETRRVIILSHGLWKRRFGGDSTLPGKTIDVSGFRYLVAGVLPEGFENLTSPQAEAYAPLGYDLSLPFACRTCRHLRMLARVKDDVNAASAMQEAQRAMRGMLEKFPNEYASTGAILERVDVNATKGVRNAVLALLGAAALLLLMSCATVSSLMLGRSIERQSDVAVRTALGARPTRIVRQSAVEAVILWAVAALLGVGLARWGVQGLVRLSAVPLPRVDRMVIDWHTLGVALGLALLSAILAGTLPAALSVRGAIIDRVRIGARNIVGRGTQRLRGALIVAEVALALVMLSGTGLLIRTIGALLDVKLGFNAERLVDVDVSVSGPRYASDTTIAEYWRAVLTAARGVPGVESVGLTGQLPLSGSFDSWGIHRRDKPSPNPENDPSAQRFGVSKDYFATMGIPLMAGRRFNDGDMAPGSRVVIVNRAMAEQVFGGESPIGKEVRIGGNDEDDAWLTVVGVVDNVKHLSLDAEPELQIYHPFQQAVDGGMSVLARVRAGGASESVRRALESAIRNVDRSLAVTSARPMSDFIDQAMAQRRFVLKLLAVFATVALVLVSAGLYGVTAAGVAERRREIGLRAALGATQSRILSTVLSRSATLVGVGVSVGIVGALLLNKALQSMLFGVSSSDPLTIGAVVGVLLCVAALASMIPARRAVSVDPAITHRDE
ncbi:MAG: ADOP family duplicated permease [Gemmatimonadota bacterium]